VRDFSLNVIFTAPSDANSISWSHIRADGPKDSITDVALKGFPIHSLLSSGSGKYLLWYHAELLYGSDYMKTHNRISSVVRTEAGICYEQVLHFTCSTLFFSGTTVIQIIKHKELLFYSESARIVMFCIHSLICRISGFHSGGYEEYHLLEYIIWNHIPEDDTLHSLICFAVEYQ
jgi:hypothetical protein